MCIKKKFFERRKMGEDRTEKRGKRQRQTQGGQRGKVRKEERNVGTKEFFVCFYFCLFVCLFNLRKV